MKRLIRIEWLKNYTYFPVILFSGLYFLLVIGFTLICAQTIPLMGISFKLVEEGFLDFPQVWNFLTYITALLKIFLGLVIIFTISNEFSQKMFKQNIIDGLSRKEFVLSKLLTISILSLISTVIVFIMGLILGYTFSKSTEFSLVFKEIYFIFGYFLKLFTFLSFLFFITVLLKRVVFVFLSFFVWWIIENILFFAELDSKIVETVDKEGNYSQVLPEFDRLISNYLPLNSMSGLISAPFQRVQKISAMTGELFVFEIPYPFIISCLLYSSLFIGGAYLLMKKRDW